MPDIYLRSVPSDTNPRDIRLYDPTVPDSSTTSRLKYWNGASWQAKVLKYWDGVAWQTKQLKCWNGSTWLS